MSRAQKNFDTSHTQGADANRDPISGEPGAHPVGVGLGAAGAGAVVGAAGGAVAGPIGAAVGAVIGGVAGGLAGKSVAESVDPTVEDAYWRKHYAERPYYDESIPYDSYGPAYRHGWESRVRYHDRSFDDVEHQLRTDWEATKAKSRLEWDKARLASRDAWDRVTSSVGHKNGGSHSTGR